MFFTVVRLLTVTIIEITLLILKPTAINIDYANLFPTYTGTWYLTRNLNYLCVTNAKNVLIL